MAKAQNAAPEPLPAPDMSAIMIEAFGTLAQSRVVIPSKAMLIRALGVVLFGVALTACSGDDDDSSGAGGYGTCDLRETRHTCIEATGSPRSIVDQKSGCLDSSGEWSTNACPDAVDLVGCCEYTFGNSFRECFYAGAATADPEAACLGMFDDGVWTPSD
jgi:hypothetical protein